MKGGTRFLLLSFELITLIFYVTSIRVYGTNPNDDVLKKLEELKSEKERLEQLIPYSSSSTQRRFVEKELQNVNNWIQHYMNTSKVMYKDYVDMVNGIKKQVDKEWAKQASYFEKEKEGLKMQYEKEIGDMREQLREAEYRIQVKANGIAEMEQKEQVINACKEENQELKKEKEKLKRGLAAETESFYQQQETLVQETNRLKQENEELSQKLKQAQYLTDLQNQQLDTMLDDTKQLKQDKEELAQNLKQAQYLTELQNQEKDMMMVETIQLKHDNEELTQKLKQSKYLIELQNQEKETMQEGMDQLKQDKEELAQKLKQAQYLTELQNQQLETMLEETNQLKQQQEELLHKLKKAQELTELQKQEKETMLEEINKLKKKNEGLLQKLVQMQELTELQNKRQETMQEDINELKKEREDLLQKLKRMQELTELLNKQIEMLKNEKKQLITENGEMFLKLNKAQDLHLKTLDVVAASAQQCSRPVHIPHKDEIDAMRTDIRVFVSTSSYKQILTGLPVRQAKLEKLLLKLHEESQLSTETALEVLDEALDKMEISSLRLRDEQDQRRQDLLQRIKTKQLVDYENDELMSMQKANQAMMEMNGSLQEIARLKAYLRGIWIVVDLMKELVRDCSNALQYSKYQPTVTTVQ